MTRSGRLVVFTLVVSLTIAAWLAPMAAAQAAYQVTNLGLGYGRAEAINEVGQVVLMDGYVWDDGAVTGLTKTLTVNGEPLTYATASAWDINDAGCVAGSLENPDNSSRGVVWTAPDTAVPLPGPDESWAWKTAAYALNSPAANVFYVVGKAWGTGDGVVPMLWEVGADGTVHAIALAPLGAELNDINELNQIAGTVGGSAALWSPGSGSEYELQTVPASWPYYTHGFAVNLLGQVAGATGEIVGLNSGWEHGMLWDSLTDEVTDLGRLGKLNWTKAYGINDLGSIVGSAAVYATVGYAEAFLYENGRMSKLNSLVDSDCLLGDARDINNDGCIVGSMKDPAGNYPAFLLTPVGSDPEPPPPPPEEPGAIAGTVLDADEAPVKKAVVTAHGPDGFTATAKTLPDGAYSIVDLPAGTYAVEAEKDGLWGEITGVVVAGGATTPVDPIYLESPVP